MGDRVKLRVTNHSTVQVEATQQEGAWLWEFLSFEDTRAQQRHRMGYAVADDRVRMYKRDEFPAGLLPLVVGGAKKRGMPIGVVTMVRPPPLLNPKWVENLRAEPFTLRSYQLDSISAVAEHKRGVIKAPTGAGKGRIAVALAHAFDGHWLFLVHRGHLAGDVRRRWATLTATLGEPDAGHIGAGAWEPGARLTTATLQTLYRSRNSQKFADLVKRTKGIIVDECHTAPADSFYKVIQSFTETPYRIGLSGTPFDRGDKRALMSVACLGPQIYTIAARTLIDAGVLAEPTVRVVPCFQQADKRWGDWASVYKNLVVESAHRNAAVVACMRKAYDSGESPGMVFVQRVAHGRKLLKMAQAQGWNATFVDGDKDDHARDRAVADLCSGRLDFIISTKVFSEGVDAPDLRTVINAAGGKSVITTLQQIGRGMRATPTKKRVTVWDIGDKGNKWLNKHAHARFAACKREDYPVVVDHGVHPEKAAQARLFQ
jgi:superfamily II DNA or RNA helicase